MRPVATGEAETDRGTASPASLLADAVERWPVGVIVVDAGGGVLWLNRAARAIVSARDGLAVGAGELAALRGADDARLQTLLKRAAAQGFGSGLLAVARADGRAAYQLSIAGLPWTAAEPSAGRAAAIVLVTDPERQAGDLTAAVSRLYGLTPAEARLAMALARGMSPRAHAAACGVSPNTVNSQLKAIFHKTGVRRQTELMRLLLTGIAAVLPGPVEGEGNS